ncbi:dihydrodipicolinate synthase family protein [Ruania alkalisoli]|uniref:Dihydrodipicolinate synthase family protein n=1 Tax=Ruania alkalisoli TaxID=2779775 RepID=A0A7M1SUF9_9MICO|nr:dihydrodipicolinate synthase family protein [Ruania alkalisoli]QOR70564.1 dihydrodipicolinate synthase family protein [Ruania alkalisoli]
MDRMILESSAREAATTARPGPGDEGWLRGIVPPVLTPFTSELRVDEAGLQRQIQRMLDAGVHGVFLLGTSGEGAYVTDDDRRRVIATAVEVVSGRVPLLVGAMAPSARQVAAMAATSAGRGVDALVCTTPFYGASHQGEVREHFRAIATSVDLPVVAYNIPGAAGVRMSPELVAELADARIITGYKDSGGDEYALRRTVAACAPLEHFPVLSGSEVMVDSALRLGAVGGVPGLANVSPRPYVELYDAASVGDLDRAQSIQDRLIELFGIARVADSSRMGNFSAGIGSFKAALVALGVIESRALLAPLVTLNDHEAEAVAAHLAHFDLEDIAS